MTREPKTLTGAQDRNTAPADVVAQRGGNAAGAAAQRADLVRTLAQPADVVAQRGGNAAGAARQAAAADPASRVLSSTMRNPDTGQAIDPLDDNPQLEGIPLAAYRLPARFIWVVLGIVASISALLGLTRGWSPTAICVLAAVLWPVCATAVSWFKEGGRWGRNTLLTTLVYLAFGIVMVPLFSLLWMVIANGAQRLGMSYLLTNMRGATEANGGAYHAIVGTLEITGIASLISIPLGILTAIFLVEYNGGWVAKAVTFLVDVMTGIPSIVAGLFAYSLFLVLAGPRYQAGVIGAIALSVLMTPVLIRGTEEMLKLVPNELREASYALGVPKWLTIIKVVLRTAITGITTSVMIAIARVIGETAPLLITVGLPLTTNFNPLDGTMATLPTLVYNQYSRAEPAAVERAWAGALTLIILVMLLNLVARLVSKVFSPKGASH